MVKGTPLLIPYLSDSTLSEPTSSLACDSQSDPRVWTPGELLVFVHISSWSQFLKACFSDPITSLIEFF